MSKLVETEKRNAASKVQAKSFEVGFHVGGQPRQWTSVVVGRVVVRRSPKEKRDGERKNYAARARRPDLSARGVAAAAREPVAV